MKHTTPVLPVGTVLPGRLRRMLGAATMLATAALFALALPTSKAHAADQATCEAKAVSKEGKPLAGAAKAASIKKCMGDSKSANAGCEAKAVGKDGKKLAGAAKASFMKKCEAQAAS